MGLNESPSFAATRLAKASAEMLLDQHYDLGKPVVEIEFGANNVPLTVALDFEKGECGGWCGPTIPDSYDLAFVIFRGRRLRNLSHEHEQAIRDAAVAQLAPESDADRLGF